MSWLLFGCFQRLDGLDDGRVDSADADTDTDADTDSDADTDTDTDADSDSDTDADPLQLDWIDPTDGPTSGGQTVRLGGQFPETVEVLFGDAMLVDFERTDTEITLTTPGAEAGLVEVMVRSGGDEAALTGGYTYWPAKTDAVVGVLLAGQISYLVGDWGAPYEYGYLYTIVADDFDLLSLWGSTLETCNTSVTTITPDRWSSSALVSRSDGAAWDMAYSEADSAYAWESEPNAVEIWRAGMSLGFGTDAATNNPAFETGTFANMGSSFSMVAPDLSGDAFVPGDAALAFSWGGTGADFLLITLTGFDYGGELTDNSVRCVVADDGGYSVSSTLMQSFDGDAGVLANVSRVEASESSLGWNNGRVLSGSFYTYSGYTNFE